MLQCHFCQHVPDMKPKVTCFVNRSVLCKHQGFKLRNSKGWQCMIADLIKITYVYYRFNGGFWTLFLNVNPMVEEWCTLYEEIPLDNTTMVCFCTIIADCNPRIYLACCIQYLLCRPRLVVPFSIPSANICHVSHARIHGLESGDGVLRRRRFGCVPSAHQAQDWLWTVWSN